MQVEFGFDPPLSVEAVFDAAETASDGSMLLLRQADEHLGLSRWFAACIPDERDSDRDGL